MNSDGTSPQLQTVTTGSGLNTGGRSGTLNAQVVCLVCSKQHEVWKCELFKGLPHEEKRKVVQRGGLCNKCLAKGHIAKDCPKVNFKCQHSGCGGGHHTLMHRTSLRTDTHTLYFISCTSFCHLHPQIAKARRGGRRGKVTAVITDNIIIVK